MVVVLTRGEALADDVAPEHAFDRLSQQFARCRVDLAHHTAAIQHHNPAGQQVQQVLQPARQARLLGQLLGALGADVRQLRFQGLHLIFEQGVGLGKLTGHPAELTIGLLQPGAALVCTAQTISGKLIRGRGIVGVRRKVGRYSHRESPDQETASGVVKQSLCHHSHRLINQLVRVLPNMDASVF